ncbi:hypothetical protein HF326_13130 [Bacillus altitudinis MN12]|nr:hypothetical protein [Bacillus altitudinis]MBR0583995.1 hypothetical protein [Bacillus altitudinis MN12]MBR0594129.1 hypothetical protein [Bacillus altitudinis C16B11]MBR0611110.1 hypothetical protein [Bacillus altitudinis]OQP19978.1 hypothetical protein B2I20_13630 [Bacillus stratosphericus]
MAETKMNVKLLAHTKLNNRFVATFEKESSYEVDKASDGQLVALSAIRTCYSSNKPSEIVAKEDAKYFGNSASDGGLGTDADRLFRQIVASKHLARRK